MLVACGTHGQQCFIVPVRAFCLLNEYGSKIFYILLFGSSTTTVTLLRDGQFDTLLLGKRDPGLVALTNDENVGHTGGELTVKGILNVDNFETTNVTLTVGDDTNTAHVTTASDHDDVTNFELDEVSDLGFLNVVTDGVVSLDQRIGVTDGATVVGNNVGDTLGTQLDLANLAKLVLGLLGSDTVDGETALNVIDKTELLTSLLNRDDIHETSRVGAVSADLSVDLDKTLHEDVLDFLTVQGILQTVAQEDNKRKALAGLVGTSAGLGSIGTQQLVEHPVLGSVQTLHVLLGSASHVKM